MSLAPRAFIFEVKGLKNNNGDQRTNRTDVEKQDILAYTGVQLPERLNPGLEGNSGGHLLIPQRRRHVKTSYSFGGMLCKDKSETEN